ncbi:MAG TPA: hypothetical protein VF037_07900 [Gemmatimonadales bacterium]
MRLRWVVPVIASVFLASCGETVVRIESDTTWEGTIEGNHVSGRGDASFTMSADGAGGTCVTIRKTTEAGTLRVVIEQGTFFDLGNEIHFEGTTTEPMGTVTGCRS